MWDLNVKLTLDISVAIDSLSCMTDKNEDALLSFTTGPLSDLYGGGGEHPHPLPSRGANPKRARRVMCVTLGDVRVRVDVASELCSYAAENGMTMGDVLTELWDARRHS